MDPLEALETEAGGSYGLSQTITALVAKWQEQPDSGSEQGHEATDCCNTALDNPDSREITILLRHTPAIAVTGINRNLKSMGRAALRGLLSRIGFADLDLGSETLLSLCMRLEDRPGCLVRLKDMGISVLPQRQKVANALAKVKRGLENEVAQLQPAGASSGILVPELCVRGYVCTAQGQPLYLNGRSTALATALPISGPVVRELARLARVAGFTVAVLEPRSPSGDEPLLAEALGCPADQFYVLHTTRRCADPLDCVGLLPIIDAMTAPDDVGDRRVVRRLMRGRIPLAVWRGGRGDGDEAGLRARLVRFCHGRETLFDVRFRDEAPSRTRRQQGKYRALLLLGDKGTWDQGWVWALQSGSVLVVVGDWLPSIPQLQAWEHFVPAKADLSDLIERVEWALNDADAPAMAARAMDLGAQLATPGYATRCLAKLFGDLACRVEETSDDDNAAPDEGKLSPADIV